MIFTRAAGSHDPCRQRGMTVDESVGRIGIDCTGCKHSVSKNSRAGMACTVPIFLTPDMTGVSTRLTLLDSVIGHKGSTGRDARWCNKVKIIRFLHCPRVEFGQVGSGSVGALTLRTTSSVATLHSSDRRGVYS